MEVSIMPDHNRLATSGGRLKRARVLAGISTRREFEKKHHISANTLQGWEQGKNPLSEKGARRIIEAFKNEGLICSIEWLLEGTGMPPRPYEMISSGVREALEEDAALAELNLHEEEAIYQETQLFKQNNPNAIIISVVDDSMEPYFSIGDYIGGIRLQEEKIKQFIGNTCIVELEDHSIIPRFLYAGLREDLYTLSCTNPKTTAPTINYYNVKIINAAPILWHRRKLSTLQT